MPQNILNASKNILKKNPVNASRLDHVRYWPVQMLLSTVKSPNSFFEKVHSNEFTSKRGLQTISVFVYQNLIKKRYQNDHDFLSFKNSSK